MMTFMFFNLNYSNLAVMIVIVHIYDQISVLHLSNPLYFIIILLYHLSL